MMLLVQLEPISKTCHLILRCARSARLLRMIEPFVHPEQSRSAKAERERRRARTGAFQRCLPVIIAAVFAAVSQQVSAQSAPSKSAMKVVIVSGGTSGLSAGEADLFFSNLRGKLEEFPGLTVILKADFAKGLSKGDKVALDKCADVSCVQSLAGKAGFHRVLLCRVTKKNSTYQFQSDEFDVNKPQKISEVTENAVCSSTEEVDSFVKKAALRIGQSITHILQYLKPFRNRNPISGGISVLQRSSARRPAYTSSSNIRNQLQVRPLRFRSPRTFLRGHLKNGLHAESNRKCHADPADLRREKHP